MFKILLAFALPLFNQLAVSAQTVWKLSTEKDGMKIYTGQVPDSKIKAVKVECDMEAKASQLVALVLDVNKSAEWMYHTRVSTMIKQVSPAELYYYSEVNLPWPTHNRDFVAHLTASQNPDTKVVVIDGPAVKSMVPEKKNVVRVNNSTGKWMITPCGSDHIKVVYTLHVEPGGSLPAWIVNMFAAEGPLKVFEQLRVQLQKPVYKNAELPFIKD